MRFGNRAQRQRFCIVQSNILLDARGQHGILVDLPAALICRAVQRDQQQAQKQMLRSYPLIGLVPCGQLVNRTAKRLDLAETVAARADKSRIRCCHTRPRP